MDSNALDGLTRALAGGATRRRLLGALGSLTMGGAVLTRFGQADAEAKRKKHKNKQGPPPPGACQSTGASMTACVPPI